MSVWSDIGPGGRGASVVAVLGAVAVLVWLLQPGEDVPTAPEESVVTAPANEPAAPDAEEDQAVAETEAVAPTDQVAETGAAEAGAAENGGAETAAEQEVETELATEETDSTEKTPIADAGDVESIATETETVESADAAVPPTFDLVRIEPDGSAVIAGTAEPDARVEILVDGDPVAETESDGSGAFVALFSLSLSDVPRVMTLRARTVDATWQVSEASVIISPVTPLESGDTAVASLDTDAPAETGPVENVDGVAESATTPQSEEELVARAEIDPAPPPATLAAETDESAPANAPSPDALTDLGALGDASGNGATAGVSVSPGIAPVSETQETALAATEFSTDLGRVGDREPAPQPGDVALNASDPEADVDPEGAPQITARSEAGAQLDRPAAVAIPRGSEADTAVSDAPSERPTPALETEGPATAASAVARAVAPVAGEAPEDPDAPSAPAVLLATDEGIEVLQPGGRPDVEIIDRVQLDTITYDDAGEVVLVGRGSVEGERFVRVYVDNSPIRTAPIAEDGSWQLSLEGVDAGIYTLRIDEVDDAGQVTSRVETPFLRETADALAKAQRSIAEASAATGGVGLSIVTVQPGFTLWGIATRHYGSGFRYVQVYNANRSRIRDPDLIYPGQVFALPN